MSLLSRKQSLEDLETELNNLLSSLEQLKEGASEESRRSLGQLRRNVENALEHSRKLLAESYDQVLERTCQAGRATREFGREHPLASTGLLVGAIGLIGYCLYKNRH